MHHQAGNRVSHLLVKLEIQLRGIEATHTQENCVVEVYCLICAVAALVVIDDGYVAPDRSRLERFVREPQGDVIAKAASARRTKAENFQLAFLELLSERRHEV